MISRNHVFLSEKLKTLTTPTTIDFNIFCWNFAHISCLPISTRVCSGFFLFCLDLELFAKIKKGLVSTHSFFTLLLITQDLNKIPPSLPPPPQTPFYKHIKLCVKNIKNIKPCIYTRFLCCFNPHSPVLFDVFSFWSQFLFSSDLLFIGKFWLFVLSVWIDISVNSKFDWMIYLELEYIVCGKWKFLGQLWFQITKSTLEKCSALCCINSTALQYTFFYIQMNHF